MTIFDEIQGERAYQDKKWGTSFDDKNTTNDWVTYIDQYAGKASPLTKDDTTSRIAFLKVAALAVAAIEALDRNGSFPKRHYD
jgi:hypothetical protein